MKIATLILVATAALTFGGSAALAQQAMTGMVTKIDRTTGTLAIQQTQSGTVGANTAGAAQEFKVQGGVSLNDWHAGDLGTFTLTGTDDARTITKLEKK
jgi:Copper binding periplasmic protein CusF